MSTEEDERDPGPAVFKLENTEGFEVIDIDVLDEEDWELSDYWVDTTVYPFPEIPEDIPRREGLFNLSYSVGMGTPNMHAQKGMKELGITYQHATAHSIADMWRFYNCSNVPVDLPDFIRILEHPFEDYIGYGLGQADVDRLNKYKEEYQ